MARKAEENRRERKPRTSAPHQRRLATEPVEEIAGRVRQMAARASNDNEPPHRLISLGRATLLTSLAALGGLIAGLVLN